ncbi:MAG: kinE 2 [Mucilaginibacter sp.]|nr:kinE 2 [Mucilaginibacter sp.]
MGETNVLQEVDKNSYQQLMEEAQKLAHFGGWEVNLLTGAVKWSSEMYQMLGYDPLITEATFKNFIKILHREDALYVKKNLETLLRFHSSDTYDFRIINTDDGSIKYLRTGIIVKRNKRGLAISMTGFSQDITGQKIAEQKIESINRELKTFFKVIDDVFFSIDTVAYKFIQVSEGCEKLFGYSQEELLADFSLSFKIFHPDDNEIIEAGNVKLAKGETIVIQYRIIGKNKTIHWVESKMIPSLDKSGKLIRIDGVTRDITERKYAELEHQRTEKRYRQIVESAQEGIWTIDENNKTNFVNKMMCDILGYTSDEIIGKDLFYFMDDEGRACTEEFIERSRRGAKENLNIRFITKTGRHVWTNINANPITDENGAYKGILAMVTDITERLLSDESLKKSEANLLTVFENTDMAFVLFTTSLNVVSFNSQATEFYLKYVNKKLKPGTYALNYFPKHKRKFLTTITNKVKNREIVSYETNFYANNEVDWYDIKWVGVLNERMEYIGILLTFKNITEKKLLELEREKITADLIQRNKDQEQFNYIVSHNLRAPVANVIGLLELLNDPAINEEDKKYVLDGISLSVKNLDSVIIDMNHVLQVKELMNETKETNNLDQLVNDIKVSISDIIKKEDVVIDCHFDVENIFSIRSYLYSIFYNLILNSIKYHKCGVSPVIVIKSKLHENKIQLTFTDNGKGINLENHGEQLFRLYKRFDTTVEGKGLGLFMVKTQVESLGGTITVESEIEKWTQFIIQLPV